jgi:S-formylglutathione hydrolase
MLSQPLPGFIRAFFFLILFAHPALPQQATERVASGKLIEIKIAAPSLIGNLLGDPADQNVTIYLPPSYDTSPAKRYPTVYLLHPFGASNKIWSNSDPRRGVPIQPALDALMSSGKVREIIVVAPNGKNAYNGSLYANSVATGNWEDYIYRDVIAYVDSNFRTLARPSSRGIAGYSMGGYGAISIAMKHPDVFSALYALSPCCLAMEGDFKETNPAWKRVVNLTSKDQLPKEPKSPDDFYTSVFVALSAAFSPNSGRSPFYAGFPFQERNGKLENNDPVLAQWKSKMPLYLVQDYQQNLLSLRGIFIDYGQKDEFSVVRIGSTLFSKALAERSIPHVFEVYEGGTHTNKITERMGTRVFQFFSDKLDFSNP